MVPTMNINKKALIDNNFINAFFKDADKEIDYEDSIFLLFLPKNLQLFKEFLDNEYDRTKAIIEDYDYEGGYVVLVYKLDVNFIKDFNLIKESKYSKTSKKFQKLFPEKVILKGDTEHDSVQYLVFKKDIKLLDFWQNIIGTNHISSKKLEVWSNFDNIKETLNIKNIKNDNK